MKPYVCRNCGERYAVAVGRAMGGVCEPCEERYKFFVYSDYVPIVWSSSKKKPRRARRLSRNLARFLKRTADVGKVPDPDYP